MLPAPPHWAARRPPGFSAARRRAKSASWSAIQWKTALEKTTSTGSSSSQLGQVGDQRLVLGAQHRAHLLDHRRGAVDRDHAALGQPLDQHRGDAAAAAAGVEHGLVAAPAGAGRGSTAPTPRAGPRRAGRSPRPSRGARSAAGSSQSAVVTGPRSAPAGVASKASIAPAFSSVMPMSSRPFSSRCLTSGSTSNSKTPAAQVTVSSSTSIRASPASATARQCSSSRIAGSSPIFVQLK